VANEGLRTPLFATPDRETADQEKKLAGVNLLVFYLINKKRLAFCFKVCCFFTWTLVYL
jgi:hypothetical protein